MSIHSYLKNDFLLSQRDYTDDYSNEKSLEIDMTMSGRYIAKYPKISIDYNNLWKYPGHKDILDLEKNIIACFKTNKKIIIGSGSNGLLQNIVKILFAEGGNLVTPFLTFNQVEYAVSSMGAKTKRVFMNDYRIDFDKLYNSIDNFTKMVYICNPNNPTGLLEKKLDIIQFAKKVNIPIVIDESAIEFSNEGSILNSSLPENVFVVKTFSKAFGLANLRVGYMFCSKKFKDIYNKKVTSNEVSGLSCQIANQMLLNKMYYKNNVDLILKEREFLIKKLKSLNIDCFNSSSNTILTKTEFSNKQIQTIKAHGISIVPIKYQNGKVNIRIAIQDKKTNRIFVDRLKTVYNEEDVI